MIDRPQPQTPDAGVPSPNSRLGLALPPYWRVPLVALMTSFLAIGFLYWSTATSLLKTWYGTVSYQHGFAVIPICLYLAWRKRQVLFKTVPEPTFLGLCLLVPLTLGWFIGEVVNVQVIQQASLIGILQAVTLSLLGVSVSRVLAFPLAYLVFAVPVGEDLVPPLQDYTAWFTVQALQLTGIPVYLEGRFLMVPTGTWEVAKSCAGIRYILPSLALGTLFAGLTYRSWKRRAGFLLASALVPILANGIRAYLIVILAYYTDNELAVGVDHFIYGGVFFGIVMFAMFSVGLRWREPSTFLQPDDTPIVPTPSSAKSTSQILTSPVKGAMGRLIVTAILTVLCAAVGPTMGHLTDQPVLAPSPTFAGIAPTITPPWKVTKEEDPFWRPRFSGQAAELNQRYHAAGRDVQLYMAFYPHQRQGAELVQSGNTLYDGAQWRLVSQGRRTILLDGSTVLVDEHLLRSATPPYLPHLMWSWYWVAGSFTSNPYYAKWLQLKGRTWGPPGAAFIGLRTPFDDLSPQSAPEVLQEFLNHLGEPLDAFLRRSFGGNH